MANVRQISLKDISDEYYLIYFRENKLDYYVSQRYLDTKETRRLNRELGVSKLNYFNNKNGKKQ